MSTTINRVNTVGREVHNLLRLAVPAQDFILSSYGIYHRHFTAPAVLEKNPGKSKRDAKLRSRASLMQDASAKDAVIELPMLEGMECLWSGHVRDAWRTLHCMRKGSRSAKAAVRSLTDMLKELPNQGDVSILADWSNHPHRPQILRLLARYGIDPSIIEALDRRLAAAKGDWTQFLNARSLPELANLLERASDNFGRYVEEKLALACGVEARKSALSRIIPKSNPEFVINCEELEDEAKTICYIIGVVIIVATLVVIIVNAIGSWIDWMEDDDRARAEVNRRNCSEIAALSNSQLVNLIRRMLDGPTGDDDERSILRILECISCERVQQIVNTVGRGTLLDDFHGSEWDRLMIRLQACGLASFREWDDDATRRFIGEVNCATINALSENDIRQLMFNLFDGFTGDDDENAILRVMNCLDCERIRSLVRRGGMSVEDFDDEVDGAEWDRLERRFRACGIRT